MKLYRICTENKNYNYIVEQLDKYFPDGYTIINTNGAWQGQHEKSLVIEIVSDTSQTKLDIKKLAYLLKKMNNQQAVMLQVIEVDSYLL